MPGEEGTEISVTHSFVMCLHTQVKSRQLKKLFEKYQAKKAEIGDVQEQFQLEREGMLDDYRILTQQVSGNCVLCCICVCVCLCMCLCAL